MTPLYQDFSWALLLNFTFRVKHLQRRNSNCRKKNELPSVCRTVQGAGVGRGGKSNLKTDSFFWQEKLRPRTWRAGFFPPHSNCLHDWGWLGLRPRQSTFLRPGEWAWGQQPLNTTFVSSSEKECLEATACPLFCEQISPLAVSPAHRRTVMQCTSISTAPTWQPCASERLQHMGNIPVGKKSQVWHASHSSTSVVPELH